MSRYLPAAGARLVWLITWHRRHELYAANVFTVANPLRHGPNSNDIGATEPGRSFCVAIGPQCLTSRSCAGARVKSQPTTAERCAVGEDSAQFTRPHRPKNAKVMVRVACQIANQRNKVVQSEAWMDECTTSVTW